VLIRLDDGSMVEGIADLAFMEHDVWVVVDFETDAEIARRLDEYRAQLGLYIRGIRASTRRSARGVLLCVQGEQFCSLTSVIYAQQSPAASAS
jgi:ATP-dependent exoDNAse (exonuclease V) beta subunit